MSQEIISHDFLSKNLEMQYDRVEYFDQSIIGYLPKIFSLWVKAIGAQFWPNLYSLISHDLFEDLWHHAIQKIDQSRLSHFSKNLLLGQYGPNLEPFVLWFALCGFLKCCSMKICTRCAMVTVGFIKISLLGQNGQIGLNLAKNYAN